MNDVRIWNALREWAELRARLRDECHFHVERAAADLRGLGLPARDARKAARRRFGSRHHRKAALHEIGGDGDGLVRLVRAHRVAASLCLQPCGLLLAMFIAMAASPAPVVVAESILGRPLGVASRQTVFFSVPAPWPLPTGISAREFKSLGSLEGLTGVERYRTVYVRAQMRGASIAAIEAEARDKTRNPEMRALSLFEERRIQMGPIVPIWVLIVGYAAVSLRGGKSWMRRISWGAYACCIGALHLLTSMTLWAVAMQLWSDTWWSCAAVVVGYVLLAVLQCRWWLRDLESRCPVCLERFVLASTEGAGDRVLLRSACTESVCVHGHGVMVETRWVRQFRRENSEIEGLVRA